jgi:hypothetical protein
MSFEKSIEGMIFQDHISMSSEKWNQLIKSQNLPGFMHLRNNLK